MKYLKKVCKLNTRLINSHNSNTTNINATTSRARTQKFHPVKGVATYCPAPHHHYHHHQLTQWEKFESVTKKKKTPPEAKDGRSQSGLTTTRH